VKEPVNKVLKFLALCVFLGVACIASLMVLGPFIIPQPSANV
jgi:hypothetical protein